MPARWPNTTYWKSGRKAWRAGNRWRKSRRPASVPGAASRARSRLTSSPRRPANARDVPRSTRSRCAARVRGPMPPHIAPQLATLSQQAPEGTRWLHEIKLDGYRILCGIDDGRITLRTRTQQDWTHRYPELARAAEEIPVRQAWLDGELVALLPSGASNFPAMQQAMSAGETGKLVYFVFDLLYLDGYVLCGAALEDRKRLLAEIIVPLESKRIQLRRSPGRTGAGVLPPVVPGGTGGNYLEATRPAVSFGTDRRLA